MSQEDLGAFLQSIKSGEGTWFHDGLGITGIAIGLGDLRGLFHWFPTDSMHKVCEYTYKYINNVDVEGNWPWSLLWGHPYTYHLGAKRAGVTKYRKIFFCFKINWGGNNSEHLVALPDFSYLPLRYLFTYDNQAMFGRKKREKEYSIFYNWWKIVDFEWKFCCEGEPLWDCCPLWDGLLGYFSLFWQRSTQWGWTRKLSFLCCFSGESHIVFNALLTLFYPIGWFLKKSKELILKANII